MRWSTGNRGEERGDEHRRFRGAEAPEGDVADGIALRGVRVRRGEALDDQTRRRGGDEVAVARAATEPHDHVVAVTDAVRRERVARDAVDARGRSTPGLGMAVGGRMAQQSHEAGSVGHGAA